MQILDVERLLTIDIIPTLTDFLNDQLIFWEACKNNTVKTVLELGVYRLPGEPNSLFPGQSTKTLMILSDYYNFDKFISLDIDDCTSTINNCKKWCNERGVNVKNHKFVQSNSLHFDVKKEFPNGVDLIFLDTNHDDTYPEKIGYQNSGGAGMTYREICHYAKHLSKNGKMFLHDTNNYYVPRAYGMNTEGAIQRFIDENKEFGFKEHNSNVHGLGEIFRK